jgi:DNA-binding transcriptional regulator GbsR (MarR family)
MKKAKTEKKIDLGKVTDVVKKIPAFLKRMKTELERLVGYIEKAEAALAALAGLQLLTKEQKAQKRLLEKQLKAMKAYRDVLAERVCNEESKL